MCGLIIRKERGARRGLGTKGEATKGGGNVRVGRKGMRGSDARKDRERNQRKATRKQNQ